MTPLASAFASALAPALARYVTLKRALGRKYTVDLRVLRRFDRFLVEQRVAVAGDLTAARLHAYFAARPHHAARTFNAELGAVRRFIRWLVAHGELAACPLDLRARRVTSQRVPFVFDLPLARRLLGLARALPDNPSGRRRGPTYHALFALLYGLGLRAGEACRLRCDDVDPDRRLLVVRATKFGKTRLVPYGPRLGTLLAGELAHRRAAGAAPGGPLFTFDGARPVHPGTASTVFLALTRGMHLPLPEGASPPRLHDLRHSFAIGTLLRWYREGADVNAQLPALATFLGHVDPTSTSVYLTATAELLRAGHARFEAFAAPGGGS
ncbi:MAG: tyrosine-type recombinase/integrase [Polyangiaceae bacterium]|nr:tyrosine-type recombinase/integrase [Polyangiaceae bacterium]